MFNNDAKGAKLWHTTDKQPFTQSQLILTVETCHTLLLNEADKKEKAAPFIGYSLMKFLK